MNFDFSALNFETIDSTINAYPDMFLNQNERTAFRRACRIQNQFPYRPFCQRSLHSPGAAIPDISLLL